MVLTEINPKGKFDTWDSVKLNEIKKGHFSTRVGKALFENNEIKLSEICLKPSQRIPFRRHINTYSCTCLTDGLLVSRNIDGQIGLIKLFKGDNFYWECEENEMIHDLENIGETAVKIIVLEEKLSIEHVC